MHLSFMLHVDQSYCAQALVFIRTEVFSLPTLKQMGQSKHQEDAELGSVLRTSLTQLAGFDC